jgi:GT2 family glycosyltransferase
MEAVVVTANSAQDLRGLISCRPLRNSFTRIVVVDNASTDGSPEMAEEADLYVVRKDPGGYGEAVNLGARHTRGDHFAVLNPDIQFYDDSVVERLMMHFRDSAVGLVAPGLRLLNGEMQDSARSVPSPIDLLLRRLRIDPTRGVVSEPGDPDWVVGACFLVSREAWDRIDGFDERYHMYFEDVDLCRRLRTAGWLVRYDSTVIVEHAHRAASRKSFFGLASRRHLRSATLFYLLHLRSRLRALLSGLR